MAVHGALAAFNPERNISQSILKDLPFTLSPTGLRATDAKKRAVFIVVVGRRHLDFCKV